LALASLLLDLMSYNLDFANDFALSLFDLPPLLRIDELDKPIFLSLILSARDILLLLPLIND